MEDKYLQDELNEARTALSIKKNALQRANQKIDELKDDIAVLKKEKHDLEFELDKMKLLAYAIEEFYPSLPFEGRECFGEILKKVGYGVSVKETFTVFELRS